MTCRSLKKLQRAYTYLPGYTAAVFLLADAWTA